MNKTIWPAIPTIFHSRNVILSAVNWDHTVNNSIHFFLYFAAWDSYFPVLLPGPGLFIPLIGSNCHLLIHTAILRRTFLRVRMPRRKKEVVEMINIIRNTDFDAGLFSKEVACLDDWKIIPAVIVKKCLKGNVYWDAQNEWSDNLKKCIVLFCSSNDHVFIC